MSKLRAHFGDDPGPLTMMYRVNAGFISPQHWIQDPQAGGGRILGEVCHFVDTMQVLTGAEPVSVFARSIATADAAQMPQDNVLITLGFADGSVGTIGYFAQGAKSLPKEQLEVHGAGRSAVLDNFTRVELAAGGSRRTVRTSGKGYAEEVAAFVASLSTGIPALPPASAVATTLATFRMLESLEKRAPVAVDTASLLPEGK